MKHINIMPADGGDDIRYNDASNDKDENNLYMGFKYELSLE